MSRRLEILFAVICAATAAISFGQSSRPAVQYPTKPLRLIVPFPAGGGADYWGRLVAKELGARLDQPVIIDNIPGMGGNNGTAAAAIASPDGYTLLLGSVGPLAVHPYTYSSLAFNAEKDFVPVALLESSPILLVESKGVPASSAAQLIALARAKPESLSYASNGDGSPEQVAGELFKKRANVEIRHLPYDGAGPARKAVLSGQASLMFDPCKGALPAIQQGLQKALAVAAPSRLPGMPDVPTFDEIGIPHYELRIWTGILAPAGTPAAIVAKLNQAIGSMLQAPEIRKAITEEGGESASTTPGEFSAFLQSERTRWSDLVRESGVSKVR